MFLGKEFIPTRMSLRTCWCRMCCILDNLLDICLTQALKRLQWMLHRKRAQVTPEMERETNKQTNKNNHCKALKNKRHDEHLSLWKSSLEEGRRISWYRLLFGATDGSTKDTLNTESTKSEHLQLSSSKCHMGPMLLGESKLSQVIFRNCQLATVPSSQQHTLRFALISRRKTATA